MDSGNSASIQSSSGNDEDFDSSRGESISSFFNPSPNFGSISAPNPQFLARQNPNFFDDPVWSAGLRSSHLNLPNFGGLNPAPSSSSHQQSPFFPIQSPPPPRAVSDGHGTSKPPSDNHHHNLSAVVKNPKKRTRASRRAPTTVLTTDTTNFRQMVQEFTGIPSSPFAGTSPYGRRLDLFSSPSSSAAAAALRLGSHFDTLGPLYSLRPQFPPPAPPQPATSPPPRLNSTMIDSIVPSTSMINPNSTPDHLLSLQNPAIPLQLGGNPSSLGRFGNGRDQNGNDEEDENLRRWKSGETVRNHDGDEENVATTAFDHHGNIDRSHHQHQHQISNMSLKNLAEKGMGSNGNGGGGSSSSGTVTVAPWIYPSQ